MYCKRCGYEIDTRNKLLDGSVRCENCGMVYRPRQNSAPQTDYRNSRDNKSYGNRGQRSSALSARKSGGRNGALQRFLGTSIGNIPLWLIVLGLAVIVVLLMIIISGAGKKNAGDENPYAEQYKLLTRLEKAYNKRDIYAVYECLDPRMMDAVKAVVSLTGYDADAIFKLIPYVSQQVGSSGMLEAEDQGTLKITPISCESDDIDGIINCTFELSFLDGTIESTDVLLPIVKVDGTWYIADRGTNIEDENGSEVLNPGEYAINNRSAYISDQCFIDGYALEGFENRSGSSCVALINEDGNMICGFDVDGILDKSSGTRCTFYPPRDGSFYYRIDQSEDAFVIIDVNGNELYRQHTDEGEEYNIVGYGGGVYLVIRHRENFSENSYALYAIDPYGNRISDEEAVEEGELREAYYYMGEGIFIKGSRAGKRFYSVRSGSFFKLDNSNGEADWTDYSSFVDGAAAVFLSGRGIYSITPEDLAGAQAYDEWLASASPFVPSEAYSGTLYALNDGVFYNDGDATYYDTHGNTICSLKEIIEKYTVVQKGWFSDGYAPLVLEGKDRMDYITVIDESARFQYDPIKVGDGISLTQELYAINETRWITKLFFTKGFVYMKTQENGGIVITPQGEKIKADDEYYYLGAADGYIYYANGYRRIEDMSYVESIHENDSTVWY